MTNYLPDHFRDADARNVRLARLHAAQRIADTTVPFKVPEEYDPTTMTCETHACPARGTTQVVVGAWDQPAHFVDPSRIYLLGCGCEAM